MKSAQYLQKVRHLEWLHGIAKEYESQIDLVGRAGQKMTIEAVCYTYHGPGKLQLNPHRSIDAAFILDGMKDAYCKLLDEIGWLENELKSVTVEL